MTVWLAPGLRFDPIAFDRRYCLPLSQGGMGFFGFVQRAWSKVEVAAKFIDTWHVREICMHLEQISEGNISRFALSAPPSMSKSLLMSALWPAWEWTWRADQSYYFCHYSPDLARRDARRHRDLVLGEWYQERWPTKLLDEGVTEFRNSKGGFRFSVSIGQAGPGRHVSRVIVDDPIKPIETQGTNEITGKALAKVVQVATATLPLRLLHGGAFMVGMQRLSEKDLIAHMLKLWGSDCVNMFLPMRNERNRQFRSVWGCDRRTIEGELLCAALKDEHDVLELERQLGVFSSGQLQQNPTPAEGTIFKAAEIKYYTELEFKLEKIDEWIISCDLTFSDEVASDYVAFAVLARAGAKVFLRDIIKKRLTFAATITEFLILLRKYPQVGAKLVENKANGPAMLSVLEHKIPGLIARPANDKKVARARAASIWLQAGQFYMPLENAHWLSGVERSLLGFPFLEHDDDVDAISQGLNYFTENQNSLYAALASGGLVLPGGFRM